MPCISLKYYRTSRVSWREFLLRQERLVWVRVWLAGISWSWLFKLYMERLMARRSDKPGVRSSLRV